MVWGAVASFAAPFVGNYLLQKDNQKFQASQVQATANEMRMARKEAGDDALSYFNKISPNSTEFERLGVSGSAVGAVAGAPTQSAIARGNQAIQAQGQDQQFKLQQVELLQRGIDRQIQAKTQNEVAEKNNQASIINTALQQGATPAQSINIADVATSQPTATQGEAYLQKQLPAIKSAIKKNDTDLLHKQADSMIKSGELTVKQRQQLMDALNSKNPWDAISKMFGQLTPEVRGNAYRGDIGSTESKVNSLYGVR